MANTFVGRPSAADWANLSSIYSNILADYTAKNLDSIVMPAAQRLQAAQVNLASINIPQVAQSVQMYQSSFTSGNAAQGISVIPASAIPSALYNLQHSGFAFTLRNTIIRCNSMASDLSGTASIARPHLVMAGYLPPHPTQPPCKPGSKCDPTAGGGRYNCQIDGALNLAVGAAFATIGFMALPEVAVLAGGYWAATALWGGLATTGWGFGHAMFCGF